MIITIESVNECVNAGYWMSVAYRIEGEMTLGETGISQRLTFDRLAWQLCKTCVLNKYGISWNPLICVCRKSSKRTANLFYYIFARGKRQGISLPLGFFSNHFCVTPLTSFKWIPDFQRIY